MKTKNVEKIIIQVPVNRETIFRKVISDLVSVSTPEIDFDFGLEEIENEIKEEQAKKAEIVKKVMEDAIKDSKKKL